MILLVIAILAGAGITAFAARRHVARLERDTADDRETANEAAIRDLYDHYHTGIEALTQAYLLQAASDAEWLDRIKATVSTTGEPQQDEPAQVSGPLPVKTTRMSLAVSILNYGAGPLFAILMAGAIIAGGLLLAPGLTVVIMLIAGGYFVSVRVHPLRKCPTCQMTGRHFGSSYMASYRRCARCDGSGRVDRLGTKVFFGGTTDTGIFPKSKK